MGIIHWSIPFDLALWMKRHYGVADFIETGTNVGDTALWAAGHFDRVVTIEADPRLRDVAAGRLDAHPHAEVILGTSQQALAGILAGRGRSLVWLDAHWSGPGTSGEDYECPIIEEIRLVDAAGGEHLILIDDARLFLNPPPPPHKAEHWPAIGAILDVLREKHPDAYVGIWRDVIVRIPREDHGAFEAFCRDSDLAGAQAAAAEAAALREQLSRAEQRHAAMLASTSWRLSAPMRALKSLIGAR